MDTQFNKNDDRKEIKTKKTHQNFLRNGLQAPTVQYRSLWKSW